MVQALFGLIFALIVAGMVIAGSTLVQIVRSVLGSLFRGGQEAAEALPEDVRLRTARERFQRELNAQKEAAKQAKQHNKRIQRYWTFAAIGLGLLSAGLLTSADLNALVALGGGVTVAALIQWLGGIVSRPATAADFQAPPIKVAKREEIHAPTVNAEGLPAGRAELVQGVIAEAAESLRELDALMPKLRHPDTVAAVANIVAVGNRLMVAVAAAPEQLSVIQRLFTYYCPQAVKVAEGLATLEAASAPDVDRIRATQVVLKKLSALFDKSELDLAQGDRRELDIDVRMLEQSLEADLKIKV